MTTELATAPYKVSRHLAKWDGDWSDDQIARGEAGPPREVMVATWWYDADGTEITDPSRIAELEQQIAPEGAIDGTNDATG